MIIALVEDEETGAWDVKLQPNLPDDLKKMQSGYYDAGQIGLVLNSVADILLRTFVGEVRAQDRGELDRDPGQSSQIVIAPASTDLDKLPKPGPG